MWGVTSGLDLGDMSEHDLSLVFTLYFSTTKFGTYRPLKNNNDDDAVVLDQVGLVMFIPIFFKDLHISGFDL